MMGKTIRNGIEFERVSLTAEELDQVYGEVMDHNIGVVQDSKDRADKEFPELEPERRLQVALFLASKASVHIFGVEKEALERKIGIIKDEANGRVMKKIESGGNHDE